MKPSFFSLFKRGKYYRPPPSVVGGEGKSERREVERFAVAAVAFCLEHDEGFRKHFWEKVCKHERGPHLEDGFRVEIEEENWSDLKITNGNCMAVVEFKAGAPLYAKQNPTKKAFWNEKGYGQEMLSQNQNVHRFCYTILGHGEHLGINNGKLLCPPQWSCRSFELGPSKGIIYAQEKWSVLYNGLKPTRIIEDLFDCLATINIEEFKLMSTKKIRVTGRLNATAADAVTVIEEVKKTFDLEGSYGNEAGADDWWLGRNIERVGSKYRKRFQSMTGKQNWFGWFGFGTDSAADLSRSVWVHFKSEQKAKSAKNRLKDFTSRPIAWDDEQWTLIVTNPIQERSGLLDYDWFRTVFEKLLSKG